MPIENPQNEFVKIHTESISATTPDEVTAVYNKWNKYDQEMTEIALTGPQTVIKHVCRHVTDKKCSFLDVGAGTGLAAEELRKAGYTGLVDGLDPSYEMAYRALKKDGLYRNYFIQFLTEEPTNLRSELYDNIVAVGSFIPNHIKYQAITELLRLLKTDGRLFMSLRKDYLLTDGFLGLDKFLSRLESNKTCNVERIDFPFYYQHHDGHLIIIKKLQN